MRSNGPRICCRWFFVSSLLNGCVSLSLKVCTSCMRSLPSGESTTCPLWYLPCSSDTRVVYVFNPRVILSLYAGSSFFGKFMFIFCVCIDLFLYGV